MKTLGWIGLMAVVVCAMSLVVMYRPGKLDYSAARQPVREPVPGEIRGLSAPEFFEKAARASGTSVSDHIE